VVDKNYARSSTRPDIQLKRKKPGGGTFVAWPQLARPGENVIVLDDSEGEQERPAAAYKVRVTPTSVLCSDVFRASFLS
jgi:hypothetical protein